MVGKTNIGAYLAMLLERRRVSLVAIAVFVLAGLLLALQVERRISSNDRVSERSEALEAAFTISSDIQRTLAFHKMLADSIASAIQADPELDQSSFATLVAPFFETNPGIRNIGVAKGSVIRFVYPLEENASVIGLDYLDTPTQASSFLRVREKLQAEFSGPVDLVQGGRGYIERVPVVVDDQNGNDAFWGMVSVVTDEAALIAQAINDLDPELGTVVTKTDSGGDQVLWGDRQVLANAPAIHAFDVGGARWQVSVAPSNGWITNTSASTAAFFLTLAATLVLAVFALIARNLFLAKRSSWEQLSEAIEAIDDGFALYDGDDRLVAFNSRYKSYYDASSDLIQTGRTFEQIIRGGVENGQYKDAIGREEEWIADRLASHNNPAGPVEQLLDDGRWLKVSEAKMSDGSTVGFRVDVTELKLAQQAAEAANQAKSEFLNTVSHEIRTPLSAIIGFSSMIQNLNIMPEYTRFIAVIEDENSNVDTRKLAFQDLEALVVKYSRRIDANGKHLLSVINDILYWNRAEVIEEEASFTRVEIGAVTKSAADQLYAIAAEKGVDLIVEANSAFVFGSEVRLKQLVLNLVGNALKFTDAGQVHVSTQLCGETAVIEVKDTGCGIPEDCFEMVFQSFTQLDSGLKRRYGGSGLGLAISRDIAEKHGGSISVSSTVGMGSTFRVTLPSICDQGTAKTSSTELREILQ